MMDVRILVKKNGERVLQKYTGTGHNRWGHVVFGWVDAEVIDEYEIEPQRSPQESKTP